MANRPAAALAVSDADREELARLTRFSSVRAGVVQRARIVLLASQGMSNTAIADAVGVSRPTVIGWRARYAAAGVDGLLDPARSGRPRVVDHRKVVAATLRPPPKRLGVTHWSSRLLARHLGVSNGTVARAWREYGVAPWRVETFKFSTDPELVAKVTDVVGLYLAPPENAVVLCVDEKSQIQALDRTAPMLPMQPGLPERRTHDFVRHGTTTLFAALEIATGKITGRCQPRHRHQEFLRFLKQVARAYPGVELHLVMEQLRRPQAHRDPRLAGRQSPRPRAFHADVGLLDEPGRGLVRDHPTAGHPPRHVRQCQGPHRCNPGLHRWLERPRASPRLDQAGRPNPRQSKPSEDFNHGALGGRSSACSGALGPPGSHIPA